MIDDLEGSTTIVSRAAYYRYAALALHSRGWLRCYLGEPTLTTEVPGTGLPGIGTLVREVNERRCFPELAGVPRRHMGAAQLAAYPVQVAALALTRGADSAPLLRGRFWETEARMRLGRPRVAHLMLGIGPGLARRARQVGALVVADARGAHHAVRDMHTVVPLARRGVSYRSPDAPLAERLDAELASADLVVCNSAYTRDSFVAQGVDPDRTAVVHLGCDPVRFTPPATRPERFTVAFVGRDRTGKGVLDLLDAARVLPSDARLVISGSPDPALEAPIRRLRAEVTFLGAVPGGAMPAVFGSVSVLALPSLSEGFGLVVLEAMACGVPAVVTSRVGAAELLRDGSDGLVVPPADPDALADRLATLHADPDLLASMGRSARATATANTWDHYAERLVAVYSQRVGPALADRTPGLTGRPS